MPRLTRKTAEDKHVALASVDDGSLQDVQPHTLQCAANFKSRISQYQFSPTPQTSSKLSSTRKNQLKRKTSNDIGDTHPRSRESGSPSSKKRRESSKYAAPSKYAHLPELQDVMEPGLICVFVGTNPGVRTAQAGHAYAHPSNLFWKLLHSSGCTDVRLRPEQDRDLPRLYSMGNTNIVARPSKDAAELSKTEMTAGAGILEAKVSNFRPEAVCIVGKGIWEAIWRWRHEREQRKEEFKYGWQDDQERLGKTDDWPGSRVFVASSTSGLSASLRPAEKEAIWRPFGDWVRQRREQRLAAQADRHETD